MIGNKLINVGIERYLGMGLFKDKYVYKTKIYNYFNNFELDIGVS